MLKVYTGQFAQVDRYLAAGLNCCSIARKEPVWFTGPTIKELAPTKELLNEYHAGMSIGAFYKLFNAQLETVDHVALIEKLEQLSAGFQGIVLLCYESPGKFCHRTIVAQYIAKLISQPVVEFP